QPRIAAASARVLLRDGADNSGSFLGLAHEENPLTIAEAGEVFTSDLILASVPGKGEHVKALRLSELFDGGDKRSCHLRHGLGSGEEFAAMLPKEIGDAALHLQA